MFGFPEIQIPSEMFEECVQSKKHKNNFIKFARRNSRASFEVIYSYVCGPIQVGSIGGNKYFVIFTNDFT